MACRHRPAGLIVHSDIVQMVKIDISLLRSIKFTQRDIIASLILLIFIVLAVILLVGGSERTDKLDIPVGLLKDELSAKADINKENLRSEHKGIEYEKKLAAEEAEQESQLEEKRIEQQRIEEERRVANSIKRVKSLAYTPSPTASVSKIEKSKAYKKIQGKFKWNGPVINSSNGTVTGPNGKETYYNLPMGGVISIMRGLGNKDKYWVRSDGCKMLGYYIMVAANLRRHPKGSIVKCSRGYAIVCDTGTFASSDPNQLDIAVNW